MAMNNIKHPNSKLQAPEKHQASSTNNHRVPAYNFGAWNFSGAWMLVLGASYSNLFGALSKC
jgi:hypothetical protein